jgi:hypothetical protein
MKIKILLCLSIFFSLFCFSLEAASTLHLVFVCDTTAHNISDSVKTDLYLMKKEMRKVASLADMAVKDYILQGSKVNTENLIKSILNVRSHRDDTILFYYSGHGFRFEDDVSNLPNFFLTPKKQSVSYNYILNTLLMKEQRLLIAIADCCNNTIKEAEGSDQKGLFYMLPKNLSVKEYQKRNAATLFRKAKGVVITTSSRPGQFSIALIPFGGCYSLSFLQSLNDMLNSPFPSDWETLLDQTDDMVKIFRDRQNALHIVDVEYEP